MKIKHDMTVMSPYMASAAAAAAAATCPPTRWNDSVEMAAFDTAATARKRRRGFNKTPCNFQGIFFGRELLLETD
jgi:hypothetical protein